MFWQKRCTPIEFAEISVFEENVARVVFFSEEFLENFWNAISLADSVRIVLKAFGGKFVKAFRIDAERENSSFLNEK